MTGKVPELVRGEMSLLLDSGTHFFTLFQNKLDALAVRQDGVHTGNFGTWMNTSVSSRTVHQLILGKKSVFDLTVVTLAHPVSTDTDGLGPTSRCASGPRARL